MKKVIEIPEYKKGQILYYVPSKDYLIKGKFTGRIWGNNSAKDNEFYLFCEFVFLEPVEWKTSYRNKIKTYIEEARKTRRAFRPEDVGKCVFMGKNAKSEAKKYIKRLSALSEDL